MNAQAAYSQTTVLLSLGACTWPLQSIQSTSHIPGPSDLDASVVPQDGYRNTSREEGLDNIDEPLLEACLVLTGLMKTERRLRIERYCEKAH